MTLDKVYHVFKVVPSTEKLLLPYGLESIGLTPFSSYAVAESWITNNAAEGVVFHIFEAIIKTQF